MLQSTFPCPKLRQTKPKEGERDSEWERDIEGEKYII